MDINKDRDILFNTKPLFSKKLTFELDERKDLISRHRNEIEYICILMGHYLKDVDHILDYRTPISMISHLTYNLIFNLFSCYEGLTIYDYLSTSYLLSDNYDDNYKMWKDFSDNARSVEQLVSKLQDANIFYIEEKKYVEKLIPQDNSEKNPVRSLLNLEHVLAKINGEVLLNTLLYYIRAIENRLKKIKTGLNDLTDDDFETIYIANYNFYKEKYWPSEVIKFRKHIEEHYFRRIYNKVEVLERLLWDEKSQFEKDGTGSLWKEYFDDKKALYFEMRRAKINEEQWKYFFKNICKFEEYERWIEELEYPNISEKQYPISEWDNIFHSAIDVAKVKIIIPHLLSGEKSKPKIFVLHKVLEEIDWLVDRMDTHFILWIKQVYSWDNKAVDFKSIDSRLKESHTLDWTIMTLTSGSIAKTYIDLANKIRKEFVDKLDGKIVKDDNKNYFIRPDLYIEHRKKF